MKRIHTIFSNLLAICLLSMLSVPGYAEANSVELFLQSYHQLATQHYQQLADKSHNCQHAMQDLCNKPGPKTLATAQQSWRQLFMIYRETMPMLPLSEAQHGEQFAQPVMTKTIDAQLNSRTKGFNLQSGNLSELEYLLFRKTELTNLISKQSCQYMQESINAFEIWIQQIKHNHEELDLNGMMSSLLYSNEKLINDRLSVPSGYYAGGHKPDFEEGSLSGTMLASFDAAVSGMEQLVMGSKDATGLIKILQNDEAKGNERRNKLSKHISENFSQIKATLKQLEKSKTLLTQRQEQDQMLLATLYDQFSELQVKLTECAFMLGLHPQNPE